MTRQVDIVEIMAVALGLGLGTLALRLVFGELQGRWSMGPRIQSALGWVPVAALAALVLPAFASTSGAVPAVERGTAAVVTAVVAWKTRNLLIAVISGMASFWIVKYFDLS